MRAGVMRRFRSPVDFASFRRTRTNILTVIQLAVGYQRPRASTQAGMVIAFALWEKSPTLGETRAFVEDTRMADRSVVGTCCGSCRRRDDCRSSSAGPARNPAGSQGHGSHPEA